jgi:hypothetical protein
MKFKFFLLTYFCLLPLWSLTLPPEFIAEYRLLRNDGEVGKAVVQYRLYDNYAYIESKAQAKGFINFFLNAEQVDRSIAALNPGGLQSTHYFSEQKSTVGSHRIDSRFFWDDNQVSTDYRRNQRQALRTDNLTSESYDPITVHFAIMQSLIKNFTEQRVVVIEYGKAREYQLKFLSEEKIDLPLGKVTAGKIQQYRLDKPDEITEAWYAKDLYYLPVRARTTDKKSKVTYTLEMTKIQWKQ